jgi:hypothetical protein
LVSHEIWQRSQALEEAIQDLNAQIGRWPHDVAYMVADTSVYIEHDDKLRDLDFAPLAFDVWLDKLVVVIVPVVVLDELDGLKQATRRSRVPEVARLPHARSHGRYLLLIRCPGHPAAADRRQEPRPCPAGPPVRPPTP